MTGAVTSPGDPRVVVRGLTAAHGPTIALSGVDLTVAAGEILTVMGRNGAGKTTLLRAIAGVHPPTAGSVAIDGHRPPRPGLDAALCPQDPGSILFAETVEDELRASLAARGRPGTPSAILERFGIGDLAGRHPRDLSAGQRLLVATAATVAGGAPVLLLDEPTRGVDPETKAFLAGFLRAHAADGGAVLLATHDVELAAAVATRVVMLAGGEVIADGAPG
jgi:energy-coupling factor transport system ATP-binding protein